MTGAEEKRATGKRGRQRKRSRQALGGKWEEVMGTERQKVRGREVLMAVCRAGLWGMQGVVGAQRCMCGRRVGEGYRWSDGRKKGGGR